MKASDIWHKISYLGVNSDMPTYMQKSTILFNQIVRIMMLVGLTGLFVVTWWLKLRILPFMFIFLFLIFAIGLFLTLRGKVIWAVTFISIVLPWFFVFISIYTKQMGEGLNLVFFIIPRTGIILTLGLTVGILGIYKPMRLLLSCISSIVAFFLFDPIHRLYGLDVYNIQYDSRFFIVLLVSFGLIALTFSLLQIFQQRVAVTYENIVTRQKDELARQNEEVSSQRDQIMAQNEKITGSIMYARRIQSAVLPPDDQLTELLGNYFVFYQPRDIVSGDFYWVKDVEDKTIVAVADCTGHGVPGAFMSILGISLLNEIVYNNKVTQAAQILDLLRDEVKTSLRQKGKSDEAKDGMDIALCVIDRNKMELQFAGANNPMYLFRDGELIEFKGDKMPIGIFLKERPFQNYTTSLQKGDTIYMFSDGMVDQFGGEQGEKFKTKHLKELLAKTSIEPFEKQKDIIATTYNQWMQPSVNKHKHYEQIDDMLILGFRI